MVERTPARQGSKVALMLGNCRGDPTATAFEEFRAVLGYPVHMKSIVSEHPEIGILLAPFLPCRVGT